MKIVVISSLLLWSVQGFSQEIIQRGPFQKEIVLGGQMSAKVAERIFVPRTESWQTQVKWLAEEGSHVEAGEVVARFDSAAEIDRLTTLASDIQKKNDELRNKEEEMASSLQEAELAVQTAEINRDKAALDANLPDNIIAQRELQEKKLALTKAEAAVEKARDELETRKANFKEQVAIIKLDIEDKTKQYERLEAATESMELRTRSGGVVIYEENSRLNRKVQVGDSVYADRTIMTIPRLETMEVEAFVSEIERDLLVPGQKVDMRLDAYPNLPYSGEVLSIAQNGETRRFWGKTAWFRVRISLDQEDFERIRPGMSVRCHVTVAQHDDALLIPLDKVHFQDDQIWVRANGQKLILQTPIGINAFHLAFATDSLLAEGMELQ